MKNAQIKLEHRANIIANSENTFFETRKKKVFSILLAT